VSKKGSLTELTQYALIKLGPIPLYARLTPPSLKIFLAAPTYVNGFGPVCAYYFVLITSWGCDMVPAITAAVPPALNRQKKSLHL
jgi:hypothetical protein